MRQLVPGIRSWSVWSERKGFDFNGYAVATGEGTVLIDPPEPGRAGWDALDDLAPFEGVLVTNRNHSRGAAAMRDRYAVPVRLHALDAERAQVRADEVLRGGECLAGEIDVHHVPGKSPGEIAFHVPARGALVVGDVVVGEPPGQLSTYPDELVDDREQLMRSAARLAELDFDALLLCDGRPFPQGGRDRLRQFVAASPP